MLLLFKVSCCTLLLLAIHHSSARNREFTTFSEAESCTDNEYFDEVSLQCMSCPLNQTAVEDPYTCTCQPGFRSIINGYNLKCEACPPSYVTSRDKRSCVPCHESSSYNDTTQECDPCSKTSVMVDKTLNGTFLGSMSCVECTNDTVPGEKDCIPCHSSFYTASGDSCTCPKTHVELGGICTPLSELSKIPDKKSCYVVKFDNGEEVQSSFLEANYRMAAHSCTFNQNKSACQLLSNICVLLHFNFNDEFNACEYYREEFGDNFVNLPDHVPWLYYPEGEANIYLSKARLKTHYSFKKDNPNFKLNFTVAKYSAEGHLLAYGRLEDVLTLCPFIDFQLSDVVQFGKTFSQSCSINVQDLWNKYTTEFYDVFLQYYDDEEHMIYAIPVLNENYKESGSSVNQQSQKKWQLTRRFFLFDNLSGKESLSLNTKDKENRARVVRYARNIQIIVRLREGEGDGLIYPPVIKINYGEVTDEYYNTNNKVETAIKVLYTMNFSQIREDLSIAIGVMSAFAALWSLVAVWSWSRRCGKLGLDLLTIYHFIVIACGNLANMFFLVVFFACFYWTIFFKRQDVVHSFLLTQNQELLIKQYLTAACFLKFIQVIQIVYVQITLDMFIIDWEKPRARNSIPHPQLSTNLKDDGKAKTEQPISIWRTYFIANEWNELQTYRRIDVGCQLFFTLFFLKVIGFENLSTADPNSKFILNNESHNSPQSYVCRFALSISVYGVIAAVQWIFKIAFYERYVENKLQQFIDLCSIANISIFILEHKMYGYYIHGRSAHGYADVDMQSIYEQMKQEEEDLCGNRGLEPSSECQIFEVAITYKFREQYDTILQPVHGFAGIRRPVGRGRMASEEMEQSFQAYEIMKRFFDMFLQHALKDLDYIVKEKLFLESVLDLEFQEADDRCLFFRNNNHAFDRVLFYGHEITFVLFEMLLFTFVDLTSYDFVLAAIVTFIFSYLVKKIRYTGGRKNVVHKTLVDQRFLM
ncbi:meckelin-like [Homarus americanus]|uniref:meckelin-like n=1 Tax=Homarus americanus TaxID=6706 RepID=UPI001C458006|nr:meckelin-like [Homarus americanus]XP_042225117.1 meckelin-like [Homarus americanus]XP_042225118.1 meckelin-like [Homarus americanus]XP_042225119.1 meckelin-like [Homarus americanus]XP_042225120.1 meckelin-like [Homarus americanus]